MQKRIFIESEDLHFPETCDECFREVYNFFLDNKGYCYCQECKKELFEK